MLQHEYPDLAEHKALHVQLRKRTSDFRASIHLITARDVLAFMKSWWLGHILGQDKLYAPYMQVPVEL